jgi:hypothetical protein
VELFAFLLSRPRQVVFHSTPMLPGIPAAPFMAVTQTLSKVGASSDPASGRVLVGVRKMPFRKIARGVLKNVRFFRARTLKETIF